jgi:hypothetical protein
MNSSGPIGRIPQMRDGKPRVKSDPVFTEPPNQKHTVTLCVTRWPTEVTEIGQDDGNRAELFETDATAELGTSESERLRYRPHQIGN